MYTMLQSIIKMAKHELTLPSSLLTLRLQHEILSKTWMFLGVFRFTKNMKFVLKGRGIVVFSGSFQDPFVVRGGPHWSN